MNTAGLRGLLPAALLLVACAVEDEREGLSADSTVSGAQRVCFADRDCDADADCGGDAGCAETSCGSDGSPSGDSNCMILGVSEVWAVLRAVGTAQLRDLTEAGLTESTVASIAAAREEGLVDSMAELTAIEGVDRQALEALLAYVKSRAERYLIESVDGVRVGGAMEQAILFVVNASPSFEGVIDRRLAKRLISHRASEPFRTVIELDDFVTAVFPNEPQIADRQIPSLKRLLVRSWTGTLDAYAQDLLNSRQCGDSIESGFSLTPIDALSLLGVLGLSGRELWLGRYRIRGASFEVRHDNGLWKRDPHYGEVGDLYLHQTDAGEIRIELRPKISMACFSRLAVQGGRVTNYCSLSSDGAVVCDAPYSYNPQVMRNSWQYDTVFSCPARALTTRDGAAGPTFTGQARDRCIDLRGSLPTGSGGAVDVELELWL